MKLVEATTDDAEEILRLQKIAYQSEAELNGDYMIPPLTQTLEELQRELSAKYIIKVLHESRIVGSGQARVESGTCHIGRMAVDPSLRGRGIGTQILSALEARFSEVTRFELFTGENSLPNLAMYQRRGYQPYKKAMLGKTAVVFLEKLRVGS